MTPREYMVKFREERKVDLQTMAKACDVSPRILDMLESNDKAVTHPSFVARIGKKYKLTKEQIEGMLPENYRKSSPFYDPDRYKVHLQVIDK